MPWPLESQKDESKDRSLVALVSSYTGHVQFLREWLPRPLKCRHLVGVFAKNVKMRFGLFISLCKLPPLRQSGTATPGPMNTVCSVPHPAEAKTYKKSAPERHKCEADSLGPCRSILQSIRYPSADLALGEVYS